MNLRGFFLLTAFLVVSASASVLSDLANSLGAHKWGIMPVNATLSPLNLHYSLLYWNDSGVWDPVKKKIRWVGGPGTCCANPADYKMITYDVEANTWALSSTPFFGSGHAYDANAFNPGQGLHYFGLIGSSTLRTWNDAAWGTLPDAPFSSTTPSLTWFPDINGGQGGLVFLGDNGRVAWYNGNSWASLPSVSLSGYNGFSQYNPAEKAVWLGGCGSSANYLLNADLTVRKLADAPFSLANGSTMQTCDPVSGEHLVYNHDTDLWWKLDPSQGGWSQVTDMSPKFSLASAFRVPIPEYGVILVFNFSTPVKSAYVYKHAASASAQAWRGTAGFPLEISPHPVAGRAVIFSPAGRAVSKGEIFDSRGRRVARISAGPRGLAWDAGRVCAGLYVLRATVDGRSIEKKVIVTR